MAASRGDGDHPLEPFEVFQQAKEGDPMRHGGNVLAPDVDLATHYARELYGRRWKRHWRGWTWTTYWPARA